MLKVAWTSTRKFTRNSESKKYILAFVQAAAEKDDDETPKLFDRCEDSADLKQKDDPAEVR